MIFAKFKKIGYWLAGITIALVIVDVIYSHIQIQIPGFFEKPHVNIYDASFVSAVSNITKFVPKNETLVVSGSTGVIKYFTGNPLKIPTCCNVNSKESLISYMSKRHFTYLVIAKVRTGVGSVPALKSLFGTAEGLRSMNYDFQNISDTKTENGRIILYKLRR